MDLEIVAIPGLPSVRSLQLLQEHWDSKDRVGLGIVAIAGFLSFRSLKLLRKHCYSKDSVDSGILAISGLLICPFCAAFVQTILPLDPGIVAIVVSPVARIVLLCSSP